MCYNISYYERKLEKLSFRYECNVPLSDMEPYYTASGFSHPRWPGVIAKENEKTVEFMRWGLVPRWVKDRESAKQMAANCLNAKSETVFEKPSFRSAISSQRCLIPVMGFFEWMDFNKKNILILSG